jgi:hypothetical protein
MRNTGREPVSRIPARSLSIKRQIARLRRSKALKPEHIKHQFVANVNATVAAIIDDHPFSYVVINGIWEIGRA